jgi:hypothetical protein
MIGGALRWDPHVELLLASCFTLMSDL